ncbi:hypothetical protein PHAVU_008G143100 [Phaseolus vulgaris]|uniref:Uncharacterized protein n=1 Tax=Phaseolus vulgaris TaxID=3885 RepID=V7B4G8_PHAVU|nr:hypothetical protein PHAVU_008G143100g [Phaseolus vulgaris]ESW12792.1 hypothetical protein PHAVU_008G143100g [Phaseolus vulgaris]
MATYTRFLTHSFLVRRLSQERELEGHLGCVNALAWNSKGSLLIFELDDTQRNIWSYSGRKLLHSIEIGHTANIFCTKFIPKISDELVAFGVGDVEVRLFNLSRLSGSGSSENKIIAPFALYQCHSLRVKKLVVEDGNPNVVWTGGSKISLVDPPKQVLSLKSYDISSTRPHLLLVGGNDAFSRLHDRRMLPPLSSCKKRMSHPPCVNYFCSMHPFDHGHPSLHLTHVAFSPDGNEVLLNYIGEHAYLMNVNQVGVNEMQYASRDVAKMMTYSPTINGTELHSCVSNETIKYANKSLDNRIPYYGIEACNDVLNGYSHIIGSTLKHECLCTRVALLIKRNTLQLSKALSQLGRHEYALNFVVVSHSLAPLKYEVAERLEKNSKVNDGASRFDIQGGRILSLSDILYGPEANSAETRWKSWLDS